MAKRTTKTERDERANRGLCRTCADETPGAVRDLCWTCYRVFDRKKKSGELSEDRAIAAGLISAPKNRGRKGGSGFEKALRQEAKQP